MTRHHQRPVLAPIKASQASRSRTLPSELLARAAYRVRVLAWVAACAGLVRVLLPIVTDTAAEFGSAGEGSVKQILFGAVVVGSLVMAGLTYLKLSSERLMLLGQIYFVIFIALIGASEAATPWGDAPFARGVPMACTALLVFPVILPMQPRRFVLVAALAIATLPPLQLLMPHLVGFPPPDLRLIAMANVPMVVAAIVAYVVAGVVYGLGKDLGRAQTMGSYRLVSPLGRGGMGEVWRAKHGMLAREAAIKLIRSDRGGGEAVVARFEHEARVVSSLRSPHTIQLYDFGVTVDGALYYAMELLDGMDFDRLVELHGPLPPERVAHFMIQACHSLIEAHEAGLVHRDIKPANLFTARVGRDVDVVKVLDFGLATKPVLDRVADTRATRQGEILGTPAYMAPEQVLGDATIDGRADLYALGAVGWFLLTGRDLFQGATATQVMFAHINVEAEAPSSYARLPVPEALDAAIKRCLAKRREDRPANAEVLAAELAAIPWETPWTRERALQWWAEHAARLAPEVRATADTEVSDAPIIGPGHAP